jgi:hypothetical protein
MKIIKVLSVIALVYVGIVVAFESLLGYFQPADQNTLVITTYDNEGNGKDRVLARLESQGQLYVAANHWPRAWYNKTMAHPMVQIDLGDGKIDYLAVPVVEVEHNQVDADNALPLAFRILTGFPPRYFYRLELTTNGS